MRILQRVGQIKFIKDGLKGRVALHKSGRLAASCDHKELFEGCDWEHANNSYIQIKNPTSKEFGLVFSRLAS